MKLLRASKNDILQLKQIWANVFNTPQAFIDSFFEARWNTDHCYIAKDKDKILSMIHCLESSFTREMNNTDVSYIVGAATLSSHRNQGLLSSLLDLAHKEEGKILTLNSNLNSYFENHGFYYASKNVCYPLLGNKNHSLINDAQDISSIYINATEKTGSIDRDTYAWRLIRDNCKTVVVEKNYQRAYALVIDDVAFETMCEGPDSAIQLKEKLKNLNVNQVWMPSNSPLSYLFNSKPTFIPMGMSNEKNICAGIYIAQQF
jgi:predicted acetyltransferase